MTTVAGIEVNALAAVEAVGRTKSIVAAAAALRVTPSAISQQIKKAEGQLGTPIFERAPGGLRPTDRGQQLVQGLELGFRQLADTIRTVRQSQEEALTISCGSAFAVCWLVPRLSRFAARYPQFRIRLDASSGLVDFAHSDIDLAIRLGVGGWPDVQSEKLVEQWVFPVCTPRWAAKLGRPEDLAEVPILFDEGTLFSWDLWFAAARVARPKALAGPSFTDPVLAFSAALAGGGVVLGWSILVADALADGRIVRPFGAALHSDLAYWLVTPQGGRRSPKAKAFKSWIVEELASGVTSP